MLGPRSSVTDFANTASKTAAALAGATDADGENDDSSGTADRKRPTRSQGGTHGLEA